MKKHILKIVALLAILSFWRINLTNAVFSAQATIAGNTVTTGDWTPPTIPGPIGWTIENPPVGSDYISGTDFDRYATCGGAVNYSPMSNIWKPSTDTSAITYEREVYSPIDNRIYVNSSLTTNYENGGGATDGTTYWVRVRAKDAAGNYSDWTPKCSVTYDTTKPTSIITTPANTGSNSIVYASSWDGIVAGTAADNLSGIHHVDISIHRSDDTYWNGSGWITGSESTVRVTTAGTTSWTYTVTDHSVLTTYTITSHAVDNAGNVEDSYILNIACKEPQPVLMSSIPTPTPTPSPEETDSPTPTPTATPEDTISPTPTPEPTAEISPTPTPTDTPTPTADPSPTDTLTPTPTPTPTIEPTPAPENPTPTPESPTPTPEPTPVDPSPTPDP
jgi:hypothetical protein